MAEVSFMVFDMLWLDGQDLTATPYSERRRLLDELSIRDRITRRHPVRAFTRFPGTDAADLYAACDHNSLEGIMLKRLDSLYLPGRRSSAWRKVKCGSWRAHAERRRPPASCDNGPQLVEPAPADIDDVAGPSSG